MRRRIKNSGIKQGLNDLPAFTWRIKQASKLDGMQSNGLEKQKICPSSPVTRMEASHILDSKGRLTVRTGTRRMGRTAALQFQLLQCPELPSSQRS